MQRLSYNQLATNFIALAMKDKLDRAKETNKATVYNEVADFFITKLHQRSSINNDGGFSQPNRKLCFSGTISL